jgi:hypothetical protein
VKATSASEIKILPLSWRDRKSESLEVRRIFFVPTRALPVDPLREWSAREAAVEGPYLESMAERPEVQLGIDLSFSSGLSLNTSYDGLCLISP